MHRTGSVGYSLGEHRERVGEQTKRVGNESRRVGRESERVGDERDGQERQDGATLRCLADEVGGIVHGAFSLVL